MTDTEKLERLKIIFASAMRSFRSTGHRLGIRVVRPRCAQLDRDYRDIFGEDPEYDQVGGDGIR